MYIEAQADEYVYEYVHIPDIPYLTLPTYIYIQIHFTNTFLFLFFRRSIHTLHLYIYTYIPSYLPSTYNPSFFAFRKRGVGVRDSRNDET